MRLCGARQPRFGAAGDGHELHRVPELASCPAAGDDGQFLHSRRLLHSGRPPQQQEGEVGGAERARAGDRHWHNSSDNNSGVHDGRAGTALVRVISLPADGLDLLLPPGYGKHAARADAEPARRPKHDGDRDHGQHRRLCHEQLSRRDMPLRERARGGNHER